MGTGLIWFRNDLRTKDNQALYEACKKHEKVIAVYIFDPQHFSKTEFGFIKTGKFRANFLIQSIQNLKNNLKNINISLLTYFEKPGEVFPGIIQKYEVSRVYFQKEWTSEEKTVEAKIRKACPEVDFHSYYQQFLFHPDDIPFNSFNEISEVFTEFRKACEKRSEIRDLIPQPNTKAQQNLLKDETTIPDLKALSLEEFEKDARTAFPFEGGEDEARKRIEEYFWQSRSLLEYKETRNGLIGKDYSSKLSAWLSNGSLSPRQVYHEVKSFEKENRSNQSTYWLIFEIIWRDFFKYVSLKHKNRIFKLDGIRQKKLDWNTDTEKLQQWMSGETSEDFVNANMKEIAATGFMSNRGRQNVNSFLAKELYHDWRYGAAYFESLLIDYDVHSNWGNWNYVSGVGNDPRDRKFNTRTQAERYDSSGNYRQLWLQNSLF